MSDLDSKMLAKIKGHYFLLTFNIDDKEYEKPIGEAMVDIKAEHMELHEIDL